MNTETYRKILRMAIREEAAALAFYQGVADRTRDNNLKKLFADLAAEERQHRVTLEGFLGRPAESLKFDTATDYQVADEVEAPDLTPDLKPLDGITIAIHKELAAMQMYTQLANRSTDPDQKKTFSELASMERGHKARLEDIYVNMAFPEVW
ncbi:MAG: ferritin family protein [Deltaproteobacteria bacterium]|nr:ferritin family protein [Deltaproteobacteria bacterium]